MTGRYGETEGEAIVFQGMEIKGVLHTTAILVPRPQDKLQQLEHFNPPLTLHTLRSRRLQKARPDFILQNPAHRCAP